MRKKFNSTTLALFVGLVLFLQTGFAQSAEKRTGGLPQQEIKLRPLGYEPPAQPNISDKEIARNPSLLLRENHTRVAFINDDMVAVYFSRAADKGKDFVKFPQVLEAYFIDPRTGKLISHKAWPTRYRRWVNDSGDTEGRIFPVQNGFLVHSGDALRLYSFDFQLKRELSLGDALVWSVRIAPMGRTIEALSSGSKDGEAEWLNFETLDTIRTGREFPGIQSISENGAVVTKLAHCIDLQSGDSKSHLCCNNGCSHGTPIFLTDNDILVKDRGFEVLSTKGEVLWKREADPELRNESFGVDVRSLQGNRFALDFNGGSRNSTFDGTGLRKGHSTILIYDARKQVKVFDASVRLPDSEFDFALSPDGDSLVILEGETLNVYAVPK